MGAKKENLIQPINFGKKGNFVRTIIEKLKSKGHGAISEYIREAILFYYNHSKENSKEMQFYLLSQKKLAVAKEFNKLQDELEEINNEYFKLEDEILRSKSKRQ